MKNIHLIQTNRFSKLAYYQESTSHRDAELQIVSQPSSDYKYQNLYITNNVEIKEGDFHLYENEIKKTTRETIDYIDSSGDEGFKKIILTTDQDLIKDGIQPIYDEFLEWFCKNSSWEYFEDWEKLLNTKEPFTHEIKELSKEKVLNERSNAYEFADFEERQETLEEVALKYAKESFVWPLNKRGEKQSIPPGQSVPPGLAKHRKTTIKHFTSGAEYQAKRMYSEVFEWLANKDYLTDEVEIIKKEFEQNKKK